MSKSYRKSNLYNKTIITKKISIPMRSITTIINKTEDLTKYMEQLIEKEISDKCIVEGYIKPNSIIILSYSNGIQENQNIKFQVVFECLVCNPNEGQFISCVAKNITKAGIRAEIDDEHNPLIIFIARDHNYLNKLFSNIKPEQKIVVRIIGSRFELNDLKISVIGEIVKSSKLEKLSVGEIIADPLEIDDIDDMEEAEDIDALEAELADIEADLANLEGEGEGEGEGEAELDAAPEAEPEAVEEPEAAPQAEPEAVEEAEAEPEAVDSDNELEESDVEESDVEESDVEESDVK
jgi:DNA-directed RNA polymerase subunit E'/Rpb7